MSISETERREEIAQRLRKWSDDCEEAKTWGGPTMYPPFPLTRAEIIALAALPPILQQGEAVAWQWRYGDKMEWHTVGEKPAWFDDEAKNPRFRHRALYAAPPASQAPNNLQKVQETRDGAQALAEPNVVGQTALAYMGEAEARDHLRGLIGSQSALAWATSKGLTGQQVDSFLRGDRPLEPKLAAAMGLRRVCVYEPMEKADV